MRSQWSDHERLTLRLAPVWVLSALTGRCRFDDDESAAFWDAVARGAIESRGPGREVLSAAAADRRWLFDEFELDGRPIVSGLLSVTNLLQRMTEESRDDIRATVLRIGQHVARARGPFGRRMTIEDEQTLLLIEQLLQTPAETASNNPLNSAAPI